MTKPEYSCVFLVNIFSYQEICTRLNAYKHPTELNEGNYTWIIQNLAIRRAL